MRTHVELRSSAFPADPDEDELINPGQFGRRLATWVQARLLEREIPAGEPVAEDWGWIVPIEEPAFPLWVGCGNVEDEADTFLCFAHPDRPEVRRGLRKVSTVEALDQLAGAIDDALATSPEIDSFRWWTAEELPRR